MAEQAHIMLASLGFCFRLEGIPSNIDSLKRLPPPYPFFLLPAPLVETPKSLMKRHRLKNKSVNRVYSFIVMAVNPASAHLTWIILLVSREATNIH